ncbi:hypothetical protein [Rothia halotolerans]|uniref:hypothetical protein n=1 Tax=Rothia halotolerans TaxID=405770 RepID=UPI00101B6C13|nr:hypothetical protein [Rothia halotolerans]
MSTRTDVKSIHANTSGGTVNRTTTKIGGIAALTIAGLAMTGCSMLEGGEKKAEEPQKLAIEGSFVYAPAAGGEDEETEGSSTATFDEGDPEAAAAAVGDLYTLSVSDDGRVEVTRQTCKADPTGTAEPVTDARETAFGELGEATSETTAPLSWLEPGAFAKDKEKEAEVEVLSEDMVRVAGVNFFASDGDQGSQLQTQFDEQCGAIGEESSENESPDAEPTDPPSSEATDATDEPTTGGEQ